MTTTPKGKQGLLKRPGFRLAVATATSLSVVAGVTVAPHSPIVSVSEAAPRLDQNVPAGYDKETFVYYVNASRNHGPIRVLPGERYGIPIDLNQKMPEQPNGFVSPTTSNWQMWSPKDVPLTETWGPTPADGGQPTWGDIEPERKIAARNLLAMLLDDYVNGYFDAAVEKESMLGILLSITTNHQREWVSGYMSSSQFKQRFEAWTGYRLSNVGDDKVTYTLVKPVELRKDAPELRVINPKGSDPQNYNAMSRYTTKNSRVLVLDLYKALKKRRTKKTILPILLSPQSLQMMPTRILMVTV